MSVDVFVTATVPEVRAMAADMDARIDAKSDELKLLVSDRYMDLLSAADSVVAMRDLSADVVSLTAAAAAATESLVASSASESQAASAPSRARRSAHSGGTNEIVLDVALLASILLSTPELIWGALEVHDFAGAARCYVLAENIHRYLRSSDELAPVLAKFPVVASQWDSITAFPRLIAKAAHEALADLPLGALLDPPHDAQLWTDEAVSALAAHCVLTGASLHGALEHLLAVRLAAAEAHLQALAERADALPAGDVLPEADVTAALANFVLVLDDGLRLVHAVFAAVSPPLAQTLATFEDGLAPAAFEALAQPLLAAAAAGRSRALGRLPAALQTFARAAPHGPRPGPWSHHPLTMDSLRATLSTWLVSWAESMQSLGVEVLDQVASGPQLASLTRALWRLLDAAYTGRHRSLLADPELGAVVAGTVLHVELWDAVFSQPFADRGAELIADCLAELDLVALARTIGESALPGPGPWDALPAAALSSSPEPLSDLVTSTLRAANGVTPAPAAAAVAAFDTIVSKLLATVHDVAFPQAQGAWSPAVHTARVAPLVLDALAATVHATLNTQLDAANAALGRHPALAAALALLLRGIDLASAELPKLWHLLTLAAAAKTGASLTLPAVAFLKPGAAASTAGTPSGGLGLAPASTAARAAAHRRALASSSGSGPSCAFYAAARRIQLAALASWAPPALAPIAAALTSALAADDWSSRTRRDEWPDHPEARLPVFPSHYAMHFLFAGCEALDALGGSALHRNAVIAFAGHLEAAALEAYTSKVRTATVSDAGACQALFDVHFARAVLATRARDSLARVAAWDAVVAALEAAIDPVDLVVYAPRIATAVSLHFDRSAILLGLLTQYAAKARSSASTRGNYVEQQPVVVLAPSASRISELAVALPPSLQARRS
ncbi:uncharacterized protein AMSG_02876 [Thecamonas trahens ATCC 50062]|uniref:Conserved oligomeric Golgi complex subunit 1 n=1 Tax=Thecamonas trahens ATCC 50062 TaxID=461836 RepID=A0A0L0D2A7_THETB|nr:hypothetical protein AMSG_02876 [Thecamonas trahens ATCC 50062]KNC46422.1 hypothetical protein AMSG_02876 [Thecamonas trahens ATCC 50062]|eukprot:XP_013760713.1 hypothetical protein AMSG_02876 [Thecamonas trahens ATCC 50062]